MSSEICKLLFVLSMLSSFSLKAQSGCTDLQASNYDSEAVQNDGSCVYPATSFAPEFLGNFPTLLNENSGLAFFDDALWTHNDGGGEDRLYRLDTLSLEITKEVIIATADNVDWEDLAESETHVFIGDFGNNNGNRTDLKIHKIKKSDLINSTVVNSEIIEFSYADQTDFGIANNANNFDCEAFFYLDGNLHLFTKNWTDFKSRHYIIPAEEGTYSPDPTDTFESAGLITAASIDAEGTIVLLGYTNTGTTFLWLLFDYPQDDVLGGNKRRIVIGNALQNGQVESIVFSHPGHGYIGAEDFTVLPARVTLFASEQWTSNNSTATQDLNSDIEIEVYPNPTNNDLRISSNEKIESIDLINEFGFLLLQEKVQSREHRLQLQDTPTGFYILRLTTAKGISTRKIFVFR